jgi:hypothetical protein
MSHMRDPRLTGLERTAVTSPFGDRLADGVGLARGIAVGVAMSVPLWALIVWAGWSIGQMIAPG